jgi:hypothetical protein
MGRLQSKGRRVSPLERLRVRRITNVTRHNCLIYIRLYEIADGLKGAIIKATNLLQFRASTHTPPLWPANRQQWGAS